MLKTRIHSSVTELPLMAHRCRRASDRSLFRTRPSAQDRIQLENSPKTRSELCESPTLSLTAPAVLAAVGCNCGKETGRWVVPAASSNPPGMRRFAGREGLVVCLIWRSCSPKSSSIQVVAGPRNHRQSTPRDRKIRGVFFLRRARAGRKDRREVAAKFVTTTATDRGERLASFARRRAATVSAWVYFETRVFQGEASYMRFGT